ncbi:MAG: rubrerythrin [Oscillospiraceae bacterium]|nr:rubrerythrin [Oscillospiraceae bacterium]
MDELIYAQQGELDAVLMYNKLAEKVKDAKDAAAFKQLAAEEGRHASVFHAYTKKVLQPKKTKAVFVPLMYSIVGRRVLYPIIAKQEYAAADKYKNIVSLFPDVESVMNDETRHGDIVNGLLK